MLSKDQLDGCSCAVPSVIDEFETVRTIVKERASISRFGDGEFHIVSGTSQKCQPFSHDLQGKLLNILKTRIPGLLVGIPRIYDGYVKDAAPEKWKFWGRLTGRWQKYLDLDRDYHSAFITRLDSVPSLKNPEYWGLLRQIWQDRDILHIVGRQEVVNGLSYSGSVSRLDKAASLFTGAKSQNRLVFRGYNAFSEYDTIMELALNASTPDTLILVALGPTATALAGDICRHNRQVVDIGHLTMFYHRTEHEVEIERGKVAC